MKNFAVLENDNIRARDFIEGMSETDNDKLVLKHLYKLVRDEVLDEITEKCEHMKVWKTPDRY